MHPLFPILASLLHLATATSPTQAPNCLPKACGNLTITYPFWLEEPGQAPCGSSSFQLNCNGGQAFLSNTFNCPFQILEIFYHNVSFLLTDQNLPRNPDCPAPFFNISFGLGPAPFIISQANRELFFLYNCTRSLPAPLVGFRRLPCPNESFVGLGGEFGEVPPECRVSVVPVLGFSGAGASEDVAEYVRRMRDGLLLEWSVAGDCPACTESGGQCGYGADGVSFECHCSDGMHPATCDAKHNSMLILIVSLATAITLLFTCLVFVLMLHRKQKPSLFILWKNSDTKSNVEDLLEKYGSLAPKRYKYSELKKITRSFEDKLGEGGYGMVFKGILQDGRMVAVKLLHESKGNGEEFLNEVISIGRTSHVNIVSLLGFCLTGSKRALVYEYMSNGSLEKYIYSENPKMTIGWEILQEIAIGIARGLEYLHRGCNMRIIHFDIKPQNILLDHDFCPKITDFGLAKLCHLKNSVLSMAEARGTIGFIAPEVFSRSFGVVSTKSDVYGYGMMLLDMVGGTKNVKANTENSSEVHFPHWIYDHLEKGLQACEVTCETEEIARKMTLVGLWCIQTIPGNRPSMTKVLEMLERNINELEMPPKPYLFPSMRPSTLSSYSTEDHGDKNDQLGGMQPKAEGWSQGEQQAVNYIHSPI